MRFTPLATAVHLSPLPNRAPSHHLSSIHLPKCIRNEECFIFLQEIGRKISKSIFRRTRLFKLCPALFIYKKISSRRWCLLRLGLVKNLIFCVKELIFCNSKHFRQNIMRPCYSCYFCIFSNLNFFQTIMVSLFLAGHDQYLIMFKDSNFFEFANLSFKKKCNNAAIIYSLEENKKKQLLKQFLIKSTVYL